MAKITWANRTDIKAAIGATYEWAAAIANEVKTSVNALYDSVGSGTTRNANGGVDLGGALTSPAIITYDPNTNTYTITAASAADGGQFFFSSLSHEFTSRKDANFAFSAMGHARQAGISETEGVPGIWLKATTFPSSAGESAIIIRNDGIISIGSATLSKFSRMRYRLDYSAAWDALSVAERNRIIPDFEYIKKNTKESIKIALGARGTDHTVVTDPNDLHIDYAFYVESVTLEFSPLLSNGGPTGSSFIVDINVSDIDGASTASILSTKLSVDAGEYHSSTAATPAVISTNAIAQYKLISIDIDQIGSTLSGQAGYVTLNGYRT